MVYASPNVATCVLKTFVHFGPAHRARLPTNLMQIQGDAKVPGADRRTWYQRTGDAWLERAETLVLIAPSLVVPQESNAMLNPAPPRMADVTIVASEPFWFDPRLATDSPEANL